MVSVTIFPLVVAEAFWEITQVAKPVPIKATDPKREREMTSVLFLVFIILNSSNFFKKSLMQRIVYIKKKKKYTRIV